MGSAGILTLRTGRLESGERIGLAFTCEDSLSYTLGTGQQWVNLGDQSLLDMLAPLGIRQLRIDALPYTALSLTHSADSPVTDSAAAASAMACGQKTVNGVLCEDGTAIYQKRDGRRLEPIAVWARKRGLRVGLVTTTTVTHATPAAFYANARDRDDEGAIAKQTIASGFDVILGGGRKFFPQDLRAEAQKEGWTIVETAEALRAVGDLGSHVLGLFAESHLPYQPEIEAARKQGTDAVERTAARTAPTLPEMSRFAIDNNYSLTIDP